MIIQKRISIAGLLPYPFRVKSLTRGLQAVLSDRDKRETRRRFDMERPEEAHSPEDAPAHRHTSLEARVLPDCSALRVRHHHVPFNAQSLRYRSTVRNQDPQSLVSLPAYHFFTTAQRRIAPSHRVTVREHGSTPAELLFASS